MDRDWLAGDVAEIRLGLWLLRRVGHLTVHQDVAGLELRIGYPQLHEQADAAQDQEGDQPVPDDDRQRRTRLDEQLPRVTIEQSGRAHVRVLADAEVDDHLWV